MHDYSDPYNVLLAAVDDTTLRRRRGWMDSRNWRPLYVPSSREQCEHVDALVRRAEAAS